MRPYTVPAGKGGMKVNERRTVVRGVDWPLDWPSISVHGWGGTHVCPPQPWREIDAHDNDSLSGDIKTANVLSIFNL